MNSIEEIIRNCEDELDDDSESIIIVNCYEFISLIILSIIKKNWKGKEIVLDKIDKIVINCILVLFIFVFIMWGVYYIVVSLLGIIVIDWINDVLFGEII